MPLHDRYPQFQLSALQGAAGAEERNAEWDRVFLHFQPRLEAYFLRRVDGIFVLDDLLQETWVRAVLNIGSLESSGALWTWLITIGKNLLRDELRKVRPSMQSLEPFSADSELEFAQFLGVNSDQADRIGGPSEASIRNQVSDDEWEFLNLLCVDGLTHDEVARNTGLSSAMASRQKLRRLRERLIKNQY